VVDVRRGGRGARGVGEGPSGYSASDLPCEPYPAPDASTTTTTKPLPPPTPHDESVSFEHDYGSDPPINGRYHTLLVTVNTVDCSKADAQARPLSVIPDIRPTDGG